MKESRFLEFKSEVSNSFLMTVGAFENIGTGMIKSGITDDGRILLIEVKDGYSIGCYGLEPIDCVKVFAIFGSYVYD